jgi:hypothetical protein
MNGYQFSLVVDGQPVCVTISAADLANALREGEGSNVSTYLEAVVEPIGFPERMHPSHPDDLLRLVPAGTARIVVEERVLTGATVYAVVAIIPGGSSPVLQSYNSAAVARAVAGSLRVLLGLDPSMCLVEGS